MSDQRLTPERETQLRYWAMMPIVAEVFAELDAVRGELAKAVEERAEYDALIAKREARHRYEIDHAEQAVRDVGREFTEVREAYRRFKMAILAALGRDDPWAITVVTQRDIVDLIYDLRATARRMPSPFKEPNDDRTRHDPDPRPDAAPDAAPADDGG